MINVTLEVKVLFDNGIEKKFYTQTELDMTKDEAKMQANKALNEIKEIVKSYYNDGSKGFLYVGNTIINMAKTVYIEPTLAELKEL